MSPCESARHAGEVRRAAGLPALLPLDPIGTADTGLGGPAPSALTSTLSGMGTLPGPSGPGSLPGPGVNSGAFATVGASHGPGPVALSKATADD